METSPEETIKQSIIALSLKYNILSPHTAFVGIEKRTNATNADMVLREVPIQISADDQHLLRPTQTLFFGGGGSGRGLGKGGAMRHRKVLTSSLGERSVTRSMAKSSSTSSSSSEKCIEIWSGSTSKKKREKSSEREIWPSNDQDIVRHLINKQKFDGLWDLDSQAIKSLTEKTLDQFLQENSQIDHQVLVSVIIIAVLETRFAALATMWHGIVQKARKRLVDLLGTDSKILDELFENVRKQI